MSIQLKCNISIKMRLFQDQISIILILLTFSLPSFGQLQFEIISDPSFDSLTAISFVNQDFGIVAENNHIHLTTDGGATWKSRNIPGSRVVSINASIYSGDTLIVAAESIHKRVFIIHGLNGVVNNIYSDTSELANWYPTIAQNSKDIIIAGSFLELSSGRPFFFRSNDHGFTWNMRLGKIGSENFSAVAHRQADTFLINENNSSWNPFDGKGFFYLQNGIYRSPLAKILEGVRYNCYNNACVGYDRGDIWIQQGPLLWSGNQFKYEFQKLSVENSKVRLIMNGSDEFMFISQDADTASKFYISAYQFEVVRDPTFGYFTNHKIIDSSFYSFIDSSSEGLIPGGICRSKNFIYFTLGRNIYKVNSESIGIKGFEKSSSTSLEVGIDNRNQELVLFGLDPSYTYTYNIFGQSSTAMKSGSIPDDRRIPIGNLAFGMYLLNVKGENGEIASLKFIRHD